MGFRNGGISALFAFVVLQSSGFSDGYERSLAKTFCCDIFAVLDVRWPTVKRPFSIKGMTLEEYTAFRGLNVPSEWMNRSDVFETIRDIARESGIIDRMSLEIYMLQSRLL